MSPRFASPTAFRQALDDRLKSMAMTRGVDPQNLRMKLLMERFLARLFAASIPPWLLKGGYAMELRYRPRARITKDIDLSVRTRDVDSTGRGLRRLREELQVAAEVDLGDFMRFRIGEVTVELAGPPAGGARFPVEALLGGKEYGRFHLDAGLGDAVSGEPEALMCDDLLDFAGVPPGAVLCIARPQQFAEKIHAYTYPWTGRVNTRTKDLVDLLILIEHGLWNMDELRAALAATFAAGRTHEVPQELAEPPDSWRPGFKEMATASGLAVTDLAEGFAALVRFWREGDLGG